MNQTPNTLSPWKRIVKGLLNLILTILYLGILAGVFLGILLAQPTPAENAKTSGGQLMDRFDRYMTNRLSDSLEGIASIEKVYWLDDHDIIAPEPDPNKFGTATDPKELAWLIEEAQPLLEGQSLSFTTDTRIFPGSEIIYYLDETILSITWKELRGGACYTFSEVKIKHPSQIRRFLADDTYGSDKQYYGSDMARSVNAVTGSNGDFYKFRSYGFVTYYGKVYRSDSWLDTCFVDDKGDLLMVPRLTFRNVEEAQAFVDANNVRFSLAFGPILVKDGRLAVPDAYACGEIEGNYTRAAIAQLGQLHYMLCVTSYEGPTLGMPTSRAFARELIAKGCISAYALDGGQTAMLITNDQVVNRINFDQERTVSDIIYFATAVPSGG